MTECKGLLGKIFGHKFNTYLLKDKFTIPYHQNVNIEGVMSILKFIDTMRNHYEIRCKRCGAKVDDN